MQQDTPPPKGGVIRGVVFKTVEISVPHGRAPGSRLVVQAEGRLVTAVVPEGAQPGDVFPIHVPIELTKVLRDPSQPPTHLLISAACASCLQMQRLKLAPVQMLDWGLDKAEDLTKRAVRKIPGHDRVEALVDRVRRRRPQHPQRAVEHRRGDSRGSRHGHRADPDSGRGYDEEQWSSARVSSLRGHGSVQVVGSIREKDRFDEFPAFDDMQSGQAQQDRQQRGRPMYPSAFDSPHAAGVAQPGHTVHTAGAAVASDTFADFFGGPEPELQPVPVSSLVCVLTGRVGPPDCSMLPANRCCGDMTWYTISYAVACCSTSCRAGTGSDFVHWRRWWQPIVPRGTAGVV